MKTKKNSSQNIFVNNMRELEAKTAQFSAHSLGIFTDDGSLAGMCLLAPELTQKKITAIEDGLKRCEGLTVRRKSSSESPDRKIALLPKRKGTKAADPDKNHLYQDLQESLVAIAHQASLTRIPFAVLLLQPDDLSLTAGDINSIAEEIRKNLNYDEIFCQYNDYGRQRARGKEIRFGVILPFSGLSKARKRAEEIREIALACKTRVEEKQSLSIGLGVSYVGDQLSVQDFLLLVEKSLREAAATGNCVRWQKGNRAENSCQVTAEERSQLFGFFK